MRKLMSCIVIMTLCTASNAQGIAFMRSYGNNGYDYGRDVKQDLDSGYICTGSSSSFYADNAEAFLMKVDTVGDLVWSYNYGGEGSEWGESVVVTADSNYAMAGYTNSSGNGGFDFYFVKAQDGGQPLITQTYGGSDWDKAYDLVELPDSGFVLVGNTYSYGAGGLDAYMVRINKFGDTIWTKTYGGTEDDYLNAVLFDGDSIIAVGGTESFGMGNSDGLIIKMGLDGTIGWVDTIGMADEDYFTSIDMFGTYYVIGGLRSYDYGTTKEDMWIYKIENDNSIVYFNDFYSGSSEYDITQDLMVRDLNEDIIIAGYTKTWGVLDGFGDIIMSKFTWDFYFVTNNTFGAGGVDCPYAIEETNDDGYIIIADFALNSTGGNNIVLLKNNSSWQWFDVYSDIVYGDITLSTKAEPIVNAEKLKVYPSHTTDFIYIESGYEIERTTVYDLNGNIILQRNDEINQLNVENLASGLYILELVVEDKSYSQKFIKN